MPVALRERRERTGERVPGGIVEEVAHGRESAGSTAPARHGGTIVRVTTVADGPGQPHRFFDGGDPRTGEAPDREAPPRIVLVRHVGDDGNEQFALARAIGYDDRHFGPIVVPTDLDTFRCDLTSVPDLFTWLVPKTGCHLPAALVHDGLVWDPRREAAPTYRCAQEIDRVGADRVLRDAMGDLGTGLVRRWLMWTAVSTATALAGVGGPVARWYHRIVVVLTIATVLVLGYEATADLVDRTGRWWLTFGLPWMPEGSFVAELVHGGAGALVVPLPLALLWWRFPRAGVILAVGLALLFHITLALVALTTVYLVFERASRAVPRAVLAPVVGAVFVGAAILFGTSLG